MTYQEDASASSVEARARDPRFPPPDWSSWDQVPSVIQDGGGTDLPWRYLGDWLTSAERDGGLYLCPDFQRGHVWTREQRIAYIENKARNAIPLDILRFNSAGWSSGARDPLVCVDGFQRLTTARMFMRDELPCFGRLCSEVSGPMRMQWRFRIVVNELPTRADVLRWYLELNAGGTPHAPEELERVAGLLLREVAP